MFLDCPVAATVVSWLCRLWQAMTGCMPEASVASILAASVSEGQCTSDALLQTWHRLRLAVLHSIWAAASIAASSAHGSTSPPAGLSSSSSYFHLASRMALKAVVSMIHHDWVKCNDDLRQISGVCSSFFFFFFFGLQVCSRAQRQGPKYDIGLFHKYVVSPRRFGIGSHRSDWDGGQARFGCTLVSLLTSVVALVDSHSSNFFWRDWLIRILVVDMITPCFWVWVWWLRCQIIFHQGRLLCEVCWAAS